MNDNVEPFGVSEKYFISKKIDKLEKRLLLYQQALNKIDDFFEYAYERYSKEDIRQKVFSILNNLTDRLKES